jgi:uncharacterized membrane protein YccC
VSGLHDRAGTFGQFWQPKRPYAHFDGVSRGVVRRAAVNGPKRAECNTMRARPVRRQRSMGISSRSVVFSINCFVGMLLALYVAFTLDLADPAWAMLTVYITSSPLSGAVRAKAVYRLVGTLVGAGAMLAMVPNLVDSPELTTLAIALWVGMCLYISLLDRTPRSYVFALAGYTAALIGFPSVTAPQGVFDLAVARVEEIGIGTLCAATAHSLIFPRSVASVLKARLAVMLKDARAWISADLLPTRFGCSMSASSP